MNVIFDIGNVLLAWDPRNLYRKIIAEPDRMEFFLANICTPEWNLEGDKGVSYGALARARAAQHPDWAAEITAYDQRWGEMISGPIAGTVALLEEMHAAGVPLYAITNWNQDKFNETKQRFAFLSLFRDIVVSGEEKIIKPDRAIFDLCLRRNGLQAADSLFIDDSLKNVAGAKVAGLDAIHFTTPEALAHELAQRGLRLS